MGLDVIHPHHLSMLASVVVFKEYKKTFNHLWTLSERSISNITFYENALSYQHLNKLMSLPRVTSIPR